MTKSISIEQAEKLMSERAAIESDLKNCLEKRIILTNDFDLIIQKLKTQNDLLHSFDEATSKDNPQIIAESEKLTKLQNEYSALKIERNKLDNQGNELFERNEKNRREFDEMAKIIKDIFVILWPAQQTIN